MIGNGTPYYTVYALAHDYDTAGNRIFESKYPDGVVPDVDKAFGDLKHRIEDYMMIDTKAKRYRIEFKTSPRSNNGGNYSLTIDLSDKGQNVSGLGGIPQSPAMSFDVMREQMLGALQTQSAMLEPRMQLERDKSQLQLERFQFETDKKTWESEKKRLLDELKEKESRYTSRVAQAQAGASLAFDKILEAIAGGKISGSELGKTEVDFEPVEETPERQMVQGMAQQIIDEVESGVINMQQLSKILLTVSGLLKQYKSAHSEHEETVTQTEES